MNQSVTPNQNQEDLLNFFQLYAAEVLQQQNHHIIESLRRRRISTDNIQNLEDICKISIKFDESIEFTFIKDHKKQLQKQIDAVAQFIKNFQIGLLGQRHTLFYIYEAEIAVNNGWKSSIEFESGKLIIKPSYWQILCFNRYLSYSDIKQLWNRGEHLDKMSILYRSWWLFNPIGEIRANLRAMLLLAVENQLLGIDKLLAGLGKGKADASQKSVKNQARDSQSLEGSKVPSPVRQATLALLKETINEDKLGIRLDEILKDQDEETLIQLLALYHKNLADPNQIEEILNAGLLVLKEIIQKEQAHINIKMFGFVNVGNYHRIDVALNLSSGYLKNYIDVIPRKVAIKAILFGFVNVYTVDDITVKPNFHGVMKLNFETVALERSLRELQLLV